MSLFLDSFWRAAAYCLYPRVIALSLLPLAIMVVLALGLWHWFWDPAVLWVAGWLEGLESFRMLWSWLQGMGAGNFRSVVAPFVLVVALTPLIILVSLLLVAAFMGPALASLVAQRRFPGLERKQGASLMASITWSLGSTLLALIAFIVTLPLWLIPPLVLLVPPLIWGWLTYRVMAFDALSNHASKEERREVFRRHRTTLMGIGVVTGYLGAAPSIVWASGVLFAAAFVILIPVAIWIYTMVFAFASLWFAHYALAALERLREGGPPAGPAEARDAVPLALRNDATTP